MWKIIGTNAFRHYSRKVFKTTHTQKVATLDELLYARNIAAEAPSSILKKIDYMKRVGSIKAYGRSNSNKLQDHNQFLDIIHNPNSTEPFYSTLDEIKSNTSSAKKKTTTDVQITIDSFGTVHSLRISGLDETSDMKLLGEQVVQAYEQAHRKLFDIKYDEYLKELRQDHENQNPTLSRLLQKDPQEQAIQEQMLVHEFPKESPEAPVIKKLLMQINELNQKERMATEYLKRKWLENENEEQLITPKQVYFKDDKDNLKYFLPPLPLDKLLIDETEKLERLYNEANGEGSFRRDINDKEAFYKFMETTAPEDVFSKKILFSRINTENNSKTPKKEEEEEKKQD
jgi:hypothetical protein